MALHDYRLVAYLDVIDDYFEEEDNQVAVIQRRHVRDFQDPFQAYSDEQFRRRFRFSKEVVRQNILPMLEMDNPETQRGLPLLPLQQLLIALRFYATGSFQIVSGDLYHVDQSTVSRVVKKISIRLAENVRHVVKFPTTEAELEAGRVQFYNKANFPGVLGCIDCTHIPVQNPGGPNGELFRNRKGYMSLNVQAVVGPNREIYDMVSRWPGSTHDSRIFDNSNVKARFENGHLQGKLLGDNGYPQLPYLFTPILDQRVNTPGHRRYNIAHRGTRMTVEQFFGVWKRRFPCLQRKLCTHIRTSRAIVCACAVLYNVGLRHNDNNVPDIELERYVDVPVRNLHGEFLRGRAIRDNFIRQYFD